MSHSPSLIILGRLHKFGLRVHDKRAIAGDRFVDRLAAHDQDTAVLLGFKYDKGSQALQHDQFGFSGWFGTVDRNTPLKHKSRRALSLGERQFDSRTSLQLKVVEFDRCKRPRRSFLSLKRPCDDPQATRPMLT